MKKFTVFIATLALLGNATLIPAATLKEAGEKNTQTQTRLSLKERFHAGKESIKNSALAVAKHPLTYGAAGMTAGLLITCGTILYFRENLLGQDFWKEVAALFSITVRERPL